MSSGESPGDSTAVWALSAVSVALITILTVRCLKHITVISEAGAAMFYGVLFGLTARFLLFDRDVHTETMATSCSCPPVNRTPHTLMVNVTSQLHCYRHIGKADGITSSAKHQETFDPQVLSNLLLPPIIFHGAYSLNQRRFVKNVGPVLTFAFLGTMISCTIIGGCVYGFTRLMVKLGQAADADFLLADCLLFGAIMSITDPASVRGLLSDLRLDPDLLTLLFGESALNDAVAVVLTHSIATYRRTGAEHNYDLLARFFGSAGYFLGVLLGSLLLGFIFTVITALLTKYARLHEKPLLETCVVVLLSWSSFLTAEAAGLSGVAAVLCCGLTQARYTAHNLSPEARTRTGQLFEVLGFLGEMFIFGYVGYLLLTFPHHVFKALFISGAFLSIFISRACSIYPLSFLLNLARADSVPCGFQHFMTFSGMRGAVPLILALRVGDTPAGRVILTTALLLVASTVWVLALATDPVLHRMDIRVCVDADEDPMDDEFSSEVSAGGPDTTPGWWQRLDHKYLKPLLTHHRPPPVGCGGVSAGQEDEEQLCETRPGVGGETPGDRGPDHGENLEEGDLGLGTGPPLTREA